MLNSYQKIIKDAKRLVIKIGSTLLTTDQGVNSGFIGKLAAVVHELRRGRDVVLVSSGAIACGMSLLGLKTRPQQITQKQAVAATGQPLLMHTYSKAFQKVGLPVGQVLLTRDGVQNRERFLNAKHALLKLFSYGVVPIVNENDTVAVEELQLGDNDQLSALVAHLIDAELLLILTDIDGLYDADPKKNAKACRIPLVENVDQDIFKKAGGSLDPRSTGGMVTKLMAAEQAARYGVTTWVGRGSDPQIIHQVMVGADVGTFFLPQQKSLSSRKHWIAYSLKPKGQIIVDPGALQALVEQKKSLLPAGIEQVVGNFNIGDPVEIQDAQMKPVARGLVSYRSDELLKIKGCKTSEVEKILGYKYEDEVIHRDDLVIL